MTLRHASVFSQLQSIVNRNEAARWLDSEMFAPARNSYHL